MNTGTCICRECGIAFECDWATNICDECADEIEQAEDEENEIVLEDPKP